MIFKLLNKTRNTLREWILNRSQGRNAKIWLMTISFAESSFFPIPTDFFLLAILLGNRAKWLYYSFLTTISSVAGGLMGYLIGFLFFDLIGEFIIQTYSLQDEMIIVSEMFKENAFWAIFISAFTPIPFKIFTISAGFFHIDILIFFVASLIGRTMRIFSVGYLVKTFGKQIVHYVFEYFNYVTFIALLILALIILF
ncbi:MAG: DedA family protein [Candidatus Pacebacteria bacterium]|nr:DedA family protein [Candidatus Paceibacterota bacterium]